MSDLAHLPMTRRVAVTGIGISCALGSDLRSFEEGLRAGRCGIRELALREFGFMARTVFRMWGIQRTDDFGEIVFNLVECNLMSKTDDDDRRDFHNVFDLDEALVKEYRIRLDEAE